MSFIGAKGTSKGIEKLTQKRNNKINDFMHKISNMIVDFAFQNNIGTIVVGKNDGWKQEIKIENRTTKTLSKFLSIN